jgi:hypothetical protein
LGKDTAIDAIPVANDIPRRLLPPVCLGQLPGNPFGARMRGYTQPQKLTSTALQDQESIQQSKRDRWDQEQIHRCDAVGMIAKEGLPALRRPQSTWRGGECRAGNPDRAVAGRQRRPTFAISSVANPLWGAPRIHGELLKLGIDVGQTTVGRRSPNRVALSSIDRLLLVGLYRLAPGVLDALKIIRSETLIRWHRAGFRAYWRANVRAACASDTKASIDEGAPRLCFFSTGLLAADAMNREAQTAADIE